MTEQIKKIDDIICINNKTNNYIKLTISPDLIQKHKTSFFTIKKFKYILLLMIISCIFGVLLFLVIKTEYLSSELKKLNEENEKINRFSDNYKKKIINLLKIKKTSQKLDNNILMNFLLDMKS